jgi:NAD(P)-dependent dehydrogenase (short-subunit alcohol dehydrogenase family)
VIAIPSMASYHASKGAVTALSRNAAITYASAGIRVNAVHPGPTMTPLLMETPEEALNAVAAVVPLGRIAEPHEQASAILFLASDDASYVTGHSLLVDGGYTAA